MVGIALTTLRLNRSQIVVTLLVVAVLSATAVVTGVLGAADISSSHAGACEPAACAAAATAALGQYRVFAEVLPFLALLPAVIGAFWGAPLVSREYETGTAKLAWTQSVTRRTWVLSRMLVLGGLLALCGAVLGAAVDYWISVFEAVDAFGAGGQVLLFGQLRGWVPLGWLLLAFTLGALCGAVLRRSVPAMALTAAILLAGTIGRNIWMGLATEGEPLATSSLQRMEVIVLVLVSVLLTALTCSIVQRARF